MILYTLILLILPVIYLYGGMLKQCRIDCVMSILNRRNYICNDNTSVPSKGCAVVNYYLVTHDKSEYFSDLLVIHTTDVLQTIGIQNCFAKNIHDHILYYQSDNTSNYHYQVLKLYT